MNTEIVPLILCSFDSNRKVLRLSSEFFSGSFPREFAVHSHFTNRTVHFAMIQMGDPLRDEDGWDGEMSIYRPIEPNTNVDHLVVYHEY